MVSSASCCGSFTGKRRSRIWSSNVKMAVFAPMPSASVSTATAVNIGFFTSIRAAKRTSRTISAMSSTLPKNSSVFRRIIEPKVNKIFQLNVGAGLVPAPISWRPALTMRKAWRE